MAMDLADVQELLGHTSAKITERYAMVAPDKLTGALGVLNRAWARARENVEQQRAEADARGTAAWQASQGHTKSAG